MYWYVVTDVSKKSSASIVYADSVMVQYILVGGYQHFVATVFRVEDGWFLWNVGNRLPDYTVSKPSCPQSKSLPPWKPLSTETVWNTLKLSTSDSILCVHLTFVSLTFYLSSICLSIYLSIRLSVCLSVCLSVHPSTNPPTHPSIHLSIYLSRCLSACLPVCLWFYSPLLDLGLFFSFLICKHSVGLLWRGISPSQGRYLHRTVQTQNKRIHTSIPRVGFEPPIPLFERAKTVHALDRAAPMIGHLFVCPIEISPSEAKSVCFTCVHFINRVTSCKWNTLSLFSNAITWLWLMDQMPTLIPHEYDCTVEGLQVQNSCGV
jgi:hypothetical protein